MNSKKVPMSDLGLVGSRSWQRWRGTLGKDCQRVVKTRWLVMAGGVGVQL